MRKRLAILLVLAAATTRASAWGFVAHRIVVENAASALPAPMAGFYKANLAALSDASIEPDTLLKDRDGEKEKRRHFIDLDELSSPPFRDLPFDEDRAREKYGEGRVNRAGVLPWRIVEVLDQLREAFRRKNLAKVVSRSGWLSHYVADAYQPLHLTRNFDGQESCNPGVHAAFETDMVDRLKARYRPETVLPASFTAEMIREPRRFVFTEMFGSYALVSRLLEADTGSMEVVKKRRGDYYEEMERRVGALARSQMSRATAAVANLWYTAWVQSGRPVLPASPVLREAPPSRSPRPSPPR